MTYIVDLVFAAVFIITIISAARKGFFGTLFDLAAYVVSFVGAKLLSTNFAPGVYSNFFDASFRARIEAGLGDVAKTDYSAQIESTLKAIPNAISGIMEMIGISKDQLIEKVSNANISGKNLVDTIMNSVVSPVTTAIIRTVLFVAIAMLLSMVLRIVVKSLNKIIKKLPAIRQVNTGLGVVLGALKGALVVFLLALLTSVIAGFTSNEAFIESVNGSFVENTVRGFLNSISGYIAA